MNNNLLNEMPFCNLYKGLTMNDIATNCKVSKSPQDCFATFVQKYIDQISLFDLIQNEHLSFFAIFNDESSNEIYNGDDITFFKNINKENVANGELIFIEKSSIGGKEMMDLEDIIMDQDESRSITIQQFHDNTSPHINF